MRLSDAERIVDLIRASKGIARVMRAAKRTKPRCGHDRVVMEISIDDICDAGGTSDAYIHIDLITARKILPIIAALIRSERRGLNAKKRRPWEQRRKAGRAALSADKGD